MKIQLTFRLKQNKNNNITKRADNEGNGLKT